MSQSIQVLLCTFHSLYGIFSNCDYYICLSQLLTAVNELKKKKIETKDENIKQRNKSQMHNQLIASSELLIQPIWRQINLLRRNAIVLHIKL